MSTSPMVRVFQMKADKSQRNCFIAGDLAEAIHNPNGREPLRWSSR